MRIKIFGYQFMRDAGGYEANIANANVVTQLPATEYSDETQFLTLRDGYDQLPITLARRFQRDMGGGVPADERAILASASSCCSLQAQYAPETPPPTTAMSRSIVPPRGS
jgi:hypothetical protein